MTAAHQTLLDRFPVFSGMAPESSAMLLREGQHRMLPAGAVMFDPGNPCTGFPLLLEGSVRVTRTSDSGREVQLYRVLEGEACILSSGCLLDDVRYDATGTAETPIRVFNLSPRLFNELLAKEAGFRRWVFGLLSERLAGLINLVEAITFQRLDRRLAALLLERGPTLRDSQQKIADDLGTVREMVGRVLRSFEDRGLVKLSRNRIELLDRESLKSIAATAS